MPPEPLPWDRKEFVFKDRKHDRSAGSDGLGGGGSGSGGFSTPRWREPYHGPRDFPRVSPRRPPPAHYRQSGGNHQIYLGESSGHGCTPSRSGDRFLLEDESFRPSSGRYSGCGRSSSGSRESRGSFRRSPYWDSSGDFSRQHHEPTVTAQRSVAVPMTPASSQLPLKDHNKNGGGVDDGLGTGHRYGRDRDHSLGSIVWKPLKWTRPGSLSSAKTPRSELDEAGLEVSVPPGTETPIRSPVTSPLPSDDGLPRKKPRLGWGQGLAKYEKQKVEGSVDASGQNQSGNSTKDHLSETSPEVMGLAGSMSPATPCSAACSSSPGVDGRYCFKATNVDNDTSHYINSSALCPQNCSEEFSIMLEHLPPTSMLSSLLTDLFQPEDACSGDSTFTKNTATNRLLLFKADISKELEKTECEIDLFEYELKSLSSEGDGASKVPLNSTPLKDYVKNSSAVTEVAEPVLDTDSLEECDAGVKNVDINTPLIASSNIAKSTSLGKKIYDVDTLKSARHAVTAENDSLQVPEAQQSNPPNGGMRTEILNEPGDWNCLDTGSGSAYANFDMGSHGQTDRNLSSLIMASNSDAAKKASQVFDKAFPADLTQFDIWGSDKILSYMSNDTRIKEKLASRKRLLKFKERILHLKFRAFHRLWKEDLRLLSIRKQRPKSQKRFELSSRSSQNGSQNHRSSIRSQFTLPGNLRLVPTTELVDFTSKLLSDSQIKLYRNNLKMPALILDEERMYSRFITNNSLIEDPPSLEKERAVINPWTQEEKDVFMEMLATFGKDFAKISSFLNHKTTADCIEFYYKHHKSESFKDVKRRLDLRKQWRCLPTNTYLVTSAKKWNREANAASLDMLGAVSVEAAHNSGNTRNQQRHAVRSVLQSYHNLKASRGGYGSLERVNSVEISGYEKETAAADVLAGICGALSSDAISSCVTCSIDPPEKMNYVVMDRPLTPEVIQNIEEEDTCSDDCCGELESVDWTDEEKSIFIRALSIYGKDFARISHCVGTRSREQCKVFFSKARKCLGLDVIHPGAGSGETPMSDTNGGRSDTDDACPAEMDSAICSTQSCSKMDADFTQSVANARSAGFVQTGNNPLRTETELSSERYEPGGSNQEEAEGKLDRLASVLNDCKQVIKGENLWSDEPLKGISDAAALGCNEFHVGGELSVDTATGKGGNGHVVSPVEPATMTCIKVEELKSHTADGVQQKVTRGSSPADALKREVDSQQFLEVPGTRFGNRQQKMGMDANSIVSLCLTPDSTANESASHSTTKMNSVPSLTFATCYQQQMPLEVLPSMQKKSEVISLKQERPLSEPSNSLLPNPSSISSDEPLRVPSKSTLNFEEHRNKRHQDSAAIEFYQSSNRIDQPLHILRGYPLQMLNQKELKRDTNLISENQLLLESHSMGNVISQLSRHFVPDIHNEKSSSSGLSNSKPGTLFSPRSEDPSDAQLRSCSQSAHSETESSSHRTGDVKLFGQILSNPSLQKSNSSSQLQESYSQPLSPKQRSRPATMKPSNSRKESSMFAARSESSGHIGQEEVPLRSYGFWDGNRIQTGFSSLPESAVSMSKYQGAVVGTPFYSAKDGVASSNVVSADYQQQAYVQPLSTDGKRLDSFPELQRRSGFEMISGFQQQPGRMARLNMVGGGGILVGGGGVSDPVAALKLHYATATGRAKFLSSEVESWRGDIGGR